MPGHPPTERSELYSQSGAPLRHAWLYMPDGSSSDARPAIIVMAHGLGSIKTLRLWASPVLLQAAGDASIVFVYAQFGEGEGEPRELLSIKRQRADWRAAV